MEVSIRAVSPAEVYPLRHAILRPGRPAEEAVWPGDSLPDTVHFGAYVDGVIVGIASVYRRPPPSEDLPESWQVRGMATLEEHRGQGIGSRLLATCVEYIKSQGGIWIWCNARTPAVALYERFGFYCIGEEFELPGIGPHYRMKKRF